MADIIKLPVILNALPGYKARITMETSTVINLMPDEVEIIMHYSFNRLCELPEEEEELDDAEAWKKLVQEPVEGKRKEILVSCHLFIKRHHIDAIVLKWDDEIAKWFIDINCDHSPYIYVEHDAGKEAFHKIIEWFRAK